MLLGVLSGSAQRRAHARRAYAHWPTHPVRRLFVVADDGSPSGADELRVRGVVEHAVTGSFSTAGTVTVLVKLVAFLKHAASAPEQVVGVADDDTFVSLPRVQSLASLLLPYGRFYAGHFEWYNLIPSRFQVTGWGAGPQQAAYHGQRFANCSVRGERLCIGPFAFAEGTFFVLSRSVVRELVSSSSWLSRDAARAASLASPSWSHHVFHDVHLGSWVTQLTVPGLMYVSLLEDVGVLNVRGVVRYGAGVHGPALDGATLLSAHRLPFACWANASLALQAAAAHGEPRLFNQRLLPPACSSDGDAFATWTLRPPKARSCVLRLRPIAAARAQRFECSSAGGNGLAA